MTRKVTPRAAIPKRPSPIAMSFSDAVISAALRSALNVARYASRNCPKAIPMEITPSKMVKKPPPGFANSVLTVFWVLS
jgi:hypothetical protein